MKLPDYLKGRLSVSSQKIYLFEIRHFINYVGAKEAETASYETIVNYLSYLRSRYENTSTLHRILQSLKQYFFYLIEVGKRTDHPCRFLSIKDRVKNAIQVQDLLKAEELSILLSRKERYEILRIRNQVVMSLLVYQGLRIQELCDLQTSDIDLEKGRIKIKPTLKTNGRTLNLKPNQILLLYKYIHQIRPQLLKVESTQLLITKKGSEERGEGIHYLVSTFRKQLPNKKLTPTTIRQSVITNLLAEGKDLRLVQVFAGHKTPSATEVYRQNNLEALRQAIDKYHPH